MVADDCNAPSCTSAKERAFWIFDITDLFLPIADVSFMETANPPASSAGAVIFLPLDNRVKLCWSFALFLVSENEALFAAAFDSIDKAIISNSFLYMVFRGLFIRVALTLYFALYLPEPTWPVPPELKPVHD